MTNAETQLQTISGRVPYGKQVLLNTWLADINNAGTTASTISVLQEIETDLISYVDNNEGSAFNALKSVVNYSTDGFLTYNGKVGHNPPSFQQKVIGGTAT